MYLFIFLKFASLTQLRLFMNFPVYMYESNKDEENEKFCEFIVTNSVLAPLKTVSIEYNFLSNLEGLLDKFCTTVYQYYQIEIQNLKDIRDVFKFAITSVPDILRNGTRNFYVEHEREVFIYWVDVQNREIQIFIKALTRFYIADIQKQASLTFLYLHAYISFNVNLKKNMECVDIGSENRFLITKFNDGGSKIRELDLKICDFSREIINIRQKICEKNEDCVFLINLQFFHIGIFNVHFQKRVINYNAFKITLETVFNNMFILTCESLLNDVTVKIQNECISPSDNTFLTTFNKTKLYILDVSLIIYHIDVVYQTIKNMPHDSKSKLYCKLGYFEHLDRQKKICYTTVKNVLVSKGFIFDLEEEIDFDIAIMMQIYTDLMTPENSETIERQIPTYSFKDDYNIWRNESANTGFFLSDNNNSNENYLKEKTNTSTNKKSFIEPCGATFIKKAANQKKYPSKSNCMPYLIHQTDLGESAFKNNADIQEKIHLHEYNKNLQQGKMESIFYENNSKLQQSPYESQADLYGQNMCQFFVPHDILVDNERENDRCRYSENNEDFWVDQGIANSLVFESGDQNENAKTDADIKDKETMDAFIINKNYMFFNKEITTSLPVEQLSRESTENQEIKAELEKYLPKHSFSYPPPQLGSFYMAQISNDLNCNSDQLRTQFFFEHELPSCFDYPATHIQSNPYQKHLHQIDFIQEFSPHPIPYGEHEHIDDTTFSKPPALPILQSEDKKSLNTNISSQSTPDSHKMSFIPDSFCIKSIPIFRNYEKSIQIESSDHDAFTIEKFDALNIIDNYSAVIDDNPCTYGLIWKERNKKKDKWIY